MSTQGALPSASDPGFGLIETLRWSREHGYTLLEEHLARLEASSAALGFVFGRDAVVERLDAFVSQVTATPLRVRLVLSRDGAIEIAAVPLPDGPTLAYRVALAEPRHHSDDPALRHKVTLRDRYERPLAAAVAAVGADEVVFLNERGELCEGARTNLFVKRDGVLLTPPLTSGLLPGTLRAALLAAGEAREAILRLSDLGGDAEWFLGNSVRGLVPSELILG